MFDSRSVPFDSWWDTLTDDQRRQAHDSIGHAVDDGLRESLLEADIFLVEADLSDGNGGHRPVWLMPTAVAEFITSSWQDPTTAPGEEQFRINARKVLDEFVTDQESSRVDVAITGFTTDNVDADCGANPDTHPSVYGNTAGGGTGIDGQSFDLPTYE